MTDTAGGWLFLNKSFHAVEGIELALIKKKIIKKMGCSPSKGNNFGTLGPTRKGRMLPAPPQESPRDGNWMDIEENHRSSRLPDGDKQEKKIPGQTQVLQKETHASSQNKRSVLGVAPEAVNIDKCEGQGVDSTTVSQKKDRNMDKQDFAEKKPGKKTKKLSRGIKVPKKKDKDQVLPEQKVDFPEPLVKAHQAAYAFLNPGITKYDIILGLLEEATQTQVSMQPMVAFIALRYEEVIQGLEEMADEGEKVLKEHGDHLAWPSQIKNRSSSVPLKASSANTEPPPDLLQQLLQYTTQRMQTVSHTVGGIGDTALEEAIVYFASVSEILMEKIRIKRLVETRLTKLLSRIEMASLRKPGPEDSALFSEDSGIGAESESLAGSERQHRRESFASSGTNSTTLVSPGGQTSMNVQQGVSRQMLIKKISPSVSVTSLNSICSTGTKMVSDQRDSALGSVSLDEIDDEDGEEMDRGIGIIEVGFLKRSNFSSADYDQHSNHLPSRTHETSQDVEMTMRVKNPIKGRIQFAPSQKSATKAKVGGSPKASRRQLINEEDISSRRPKAVAPSRRATVKKAPVALERRSRSAESICAKSGDSALLEKDRAPMGSNQGLPRINKNKASVNVRPISGKQIQSPAQSPAMNCKNLSRDKNGCSPKTLKGKSSPTKQSSKKHTLSSTVVEDTLRENKIMEVAVVSNPPPSPPLSPRPSSGFCRGRNSVRKLIDTFSQGIEGQSNPEALGPLKGVRKCGVPILPGLGNMEAALSTGITSCRPQSSSSEKTDYLDLDSLPPPPLEVLMDNSFESTQSIPTGEVDEAVAKVEKSPKFKRAALSQRLRASVQTVTVLPSKVVVPQTTKAAILAKTEQSNCKSKTAPSNVQPDTGSGWQRPFYQLPQNIMEQRHDLDSERLLMNTPARHPSCNQDESSDTQDEGTLSVPENNTTVSTVPTSSVIRGQSPSTLPVSGGRMLPSTPSSSSILHRRLPSPHSIQRQPSVTSSAPYPANRKLPTPPEVQRRLPSPPVAKRSSNSSPSYLFKAPSPPASPKVRTQSRRNSSEDSPCSQKTSNVRSLFCPASSSLFEAQPFPVLQPPQAWTSSTESFPSHSFGSRGRFPVNFQGPRPFIRRSHSDQRPKPAPRPLEASIAETCGSDPAMYSPG